MAISQQNDSSGSVVQESLKLASRVDADPDAANLATNLFSKRKTLKEKMRARQDAQDQVFLVEGKVNASEGATDRELAAFGKRVTGRLVTAKVPGEKHPTFSRLFAGSSPGKLLPAARDLRSKALGELKPRVESTDTPAEMKKDARDLLKTVAAELASVTAKERADKAYNTALVDEEKAKLAVVVAGRKLGGDVQSRFAEDPKRVRRLLGKAVSGAKGKGKKAGVTPPVVPTPPM